MRILLGLLAASCCAEAYQLPYHVGLAARAAVASRAGVAVLQSGPVTQRAPPRPPSTFDGDGDGDGDGLWLRTLDRQHMVTVVGLWLWQHNLRAADECDAEFNDVARRMRAMLDWDGESSGQALPSWLTHQGLKPRFLGAYIDDEMVACVQLRYQRDTLNGLRSFVEGRHVMVVDNMLVLPSMPSQSRQQVSAGVVDSLRQMGRCHSMQVVFD